MKNKIQWTIIVLVLLALIFFVPRACRNYMDNYCAGKEKIVIRDTVYIPDTSGRGWYIPERGDSIVYVPVFVKQDCGDVVVPSIDTIPMSGDSILLEHFSTKFYHDSIPLGEAAKYGKVHVYDSVSQNKIKRRWDANLLIPQETIIIIKRDTVMRNYKWSLGIHTGYGYSIPSFKRHGYIFKWLHQR